MAGLSYYSPNHFKTGQLTATAGATLILPFESDRVSVAVVNHGPTACYVGTANVTITNGVLLAGATGSSLGIDTRAALWIISVAGNQVVSWIADSDTTGT